MDNSDRVEQASGRSEIRILFFVQFRNWSARKGKGNCIVGITPSCEAFVRERDKEVRFLRRKDLF